MAQQGATLQNYNNELVKCIEDLREKREEVRDQTVCVGPARQYPSMLASLSVPSIGSPSVVELNPSPPLIELVSSCFR